MIFRDRSQHETIGNILKSRTLYSLISVFLEKLCYIIHCSLVDDELSVVFLKAQFNKSNCVQLLRKWQIIVTTIAVVLTKSNKTVSVCIRVHVSRFFLFSFFHFCYNIGMGSGMDQSSGMQQQQQGAGDQFSGQMGDTTQFLTPNDLISQRSSPDFMPGGKCN